MNDQPLKVTAYAPGTQDKYSEIAQQIKATTGSACVALVIIDDSGNGGYSIAGTIEIQLSMPIVLEQVATQLRSQLASSVQ